MAEIKVTTTVTILEADGSQSMFGDTKIKKTGDNPRFFANDADIQMLSIAGVLKSSIEDRHGVMGAKPAKKSTKEKK